MSSGYSETSDKRRGHVPTNGLSANEKEEISRLKKKIKILKEEKNQAFEKEKNESSRHQTSFQRENEALLRVLFKNIFFQK